MARPLLELAPIAFATAIIGALYFAWIERDEGRLTAESGLGYWLGIAGGVIMLMLVAYPLRKRFRILHGLGRVANWFRFHVILEVPCIPYKSRDAQYCCAWRMHRLPQGRRCPPRCLRTAVRDMPYDRDIPPKRATAISNGNKRIPNLGILP